MMDAMPEAEVTFLFTNIDGGLMRWERDPDTLRSVLAWQDVLLRHAIEAHGGNLFKTVEDANYAVFPRPVDAIIAAIDAQRALQSEPWAAQVGTVGVRMGIHSGQAERRGADYFGQPLNRTARILYAGSGGQVLVSATTAALVNGHLPPGVALRDLGEHRLKDLQRPEHIYQVVAPGLPEQFPPLRSLDFGPNNLPIAAMAFVGRERELASVRTLLSSADVRLVTLVGAAGVGKTRLALAAAAEAIDAFPGGTYFVPLADARDDRQLFAAMASALALQITGTDTPRDAVLAFVRGKRLLLVLDSPEYVIDLAAQNIADMLATAPDLVVLATSRMRLRVRGERAFALAPLPVPDAASPQMASDADYQAAPSLFAECARAAGWPSALTAASAPLVAAICTHVDGLPLAIQLAARRAKEIGLAELLRRLTFSSPLGASEALGILVDDASDLPPRHRSLFNAIAWSYDLLDAPTRALFRRLAIFTGTWTLDDAEGVIASAGTLPPETDLFEGIEALADASFLRRDDDADDGIVRFAMLGLYREFGLRRLEAAGETAALSRALAMNLTPQPPLPQGEGEPEV